MVAAIFCWRCPRFTFRSSHLAIIHCDYVPSVPLTLLPHIRLTLPTQGIATELVWADAAAIWTDRLAAPTSSYCAITLSTLEKSGHFSTIWKHFSDLLDSLECSCATWRSLWVIVEGEDGGAEGTACSLANAARGIDAIRALEVAGLP